MVFNMNISDAREIYSMYLQYGQRHASDVYLSASINDDLVRLGASDEERIQKITHLNVIIGIEKIREVFQKFGVIQLREVDSSTKILIGCGNSPIDLCFTNHRHEDHRHEGWVTVNPEITMNPSIIAAFGMDKQLTRVLPLKFYDCVYGEAVTLAHTFADFDTTVLDVMKDGFKTYQTGCDGPVDFSTSDFFFSP
jgi:hypothetical protein